MIRTICFLLLATAPSQTMATQDRIILVQEYGAVGDGTTLNTNAIQKAVDTCSAAGGGIVYFPPGIYLSGTVFLKDNVRLVLEVNAVLRGSPRPQDYPPIARKNTQAPAFTVPPFAGGGFLIYADGVHNASIEGRGTIDGQGSDFWFKEMLTPMVRKPMPNRPLALIAIVSSESVLVRDVSLINSPCYTLWLLGCDNVNIDGITIRNPHDGPNTDGIDVDCCSNVRIANCAIDGGDDAIAVRSDSGQLGEDKPCENISVTNCVLRSVPACGVRVGYAGDSIIRNCTFNNLTIYDTDIGIDMISVLPTWPTITKGTRCENIVFNNIAMRNVKRAIFIWMGNETGGKTQMYFKNVHISNVIAQSRFGSYIGGCGEKHCENVSLSNIHLKFFGDMPKDAPPGGADIWGGIINPYAFYCTWVDGLRISNMTLDFSEAKGAWKYGILCEEVHNAKLNGIDTQGFAAINGQAVVGLVKTSAAIRGCDAEPQVPTFLHAEKDSQAFVSGCDLRQTKTAIFTDGSSTNTESGNL